MKKGTRKSPIQRTNKTKEQLEFELKVAAKRKLIIESFYPALVEATESVDEASMLLSATVSLIMEEAMNTLREKKLEEIRSRIVKKLCPNDERLLKIENLMGIFDKLSLFETRGHFESMKSVIEQMKIEDMQGRKLDSLNPKWEKYLN